MKTKPLLLLILVLLGSIQISAQDVIFKQNGEIIKTKMLNQIGSSISYRPYDNRDSLTYYISASVVDSIVYQSGKKDIFSKSSIKELSSQETLEPVYLHHLIGIDVADILLYNRIGISYEYLLGKTPLGFKAAFEEGDTYYYEPDNGLTCWNVRFGVDYYIFPPRTFRLLAGIHYVYEQYEVYDYDYYGTITNHVWEDEHDIMFALYGFFNVTKHWAFNLGFNMPLLHNYTTYNGLKCEILYNF